MLKRTFVYKDYNDVERTTTHLFNLSKSEVTELELSTKGGLVQMIEKIIADQDGGAIISLFKEIILKAYGEKSPDGTRFIKSKEISEAFSQTPAYDILFMEVVTNADLAAAFINAIVPTPPNPPPSEG